MDRLVKKLSWSCVVMHLFVGALACDKEASESGGMEEGAAAEDAAGQAEACSLAIQGTECSSMEACAFSPANMEISIDGSGECTTTELITEAEQAGMCVEGDDGGLAGATIGGVYYHVETERVFVYGIRPDPPLGWEFCGCGTGFPPACQCMDECQ